MIINVYSDNSLINLVNLALTGSFLIAFSIFWFELIMNSSHIQV